MQPTRIPYHRYRTITQGIQLIEPAWLYPRRHHDKIGSRIDQVAEPFVITDIRIVIPPGEFPDRLQTPFYLRGTTSQDQEIHLPPDIIKGLFDHLRQQISPFITDQPPYKSDQRLPDVEACIARKAWPCSFALPSSTVA